ncbi:hypothetical protein TRICI_002330 [Trichomonascus ciferrii]|uniref:Uncharacterized protein n=1 Tax=Trichomonascus ciferrii TaxID=44093 RepID=A0A6A1M0L0_9ASCO|nr:hypothetical protein TRICI_002330 [Trichomonascus ciferrii]
MDPQKQQGYHGPPPQYQPPQHPQYAVHPNASGPSGSAADYYAQANHDTNMNMYTPNYGPQSDFRGVPPPQQYGYPPQQGYGYPPPPPQHYYYPPQPQPVFVSQQPADRGMGAGGAAEGCCLGILASLCFCCTMDMLLF